MENQRGQSIFLSVVGVATLLVAIVGATFAYFSITVQGNEQASSIAVTTKVVGNVIFTDGDNVSITDIYPGWSATKHFTVANTTVGADDVISYAVLLNVTTNTITDAANGAFKYSLTGTTSHSGTTIALTDVVVPSTAGNNELSDDGVLNGEDTHTYTFVIELEETGSDQNAAQGKSFSGVLQVIVAPGSGKRTWDAETSSWKAYE